MKPTAHSVRKTWENAYLCSVGHRSPGIIRPKPASIISFATHHGGFMSTAALIEPLAIPAMLFAVADMGNDGPATERKLPERRSNLGYCILLSAVEDYMGGDQRNHRSARLLLYPADEQYAQHLQWVVGMTDLSMTYLRATLDRLRPQWDAERRKGR
jgi:hypothetical protein